MSLPIPAFTVSSPAPLVETSDPPTTKLVQNFKYVYTHRPKVHDSEPVPANPSLVNGPPPSPSVSPSNLDILIALRKGKRSCTDHPILNSVSYDHLSLTFCPVCPIFVFGVYTQVLYRGFIGTCLEAGYG